MACDRIATMGGDGIGPEVAAAAAEALMQPRARTRDLGGEASTRGATDAVIEAL